MSSAHICWFKLGLSNQSSGLCIFYLIPPRCPHPPEIPTQSPTTPVKIQRPKKIVQERRKSTFSYPSKLRLTRNSKCRSEGDAPDPHEIYHGAARAITRCIDLWCEVDTVIKKAQMIEEADKSSIGELDEAEPAKDTRDETLSKL